MDTSLTVEYDKAGDILYLGKAKPYPDQESEELDYGVVARLNPETLDDSPGMDRAGLATAGASGA
jgi:hypothetical protein